MNRNSYTDLTAVAAMPGLESIAAVINTYLPPPQRVRTGGRNPLAMAVYLACKGVIASDSSLHSMLQEPTVWGAMVASAARVGRVLPELPPTKNHHERLLRESKPGFAKALADALTPIAIEIAKDAGMLNGRRGESLQYPRAENVLLSDGVGVSLMSTVFEDEDGKVRGSRAKLGGKPRISESFKSKPTEYKNDCMPYVAVSVHGRVRWKRVVFGIEGYRDGREIHAAVDLLDRVLTAADGGVQAIAYDRLMASTHIRQLTSTHGIVPIVEIPNVRTSFYLHLPEELWIYRGDRVKTKLRIERIDTLEHATPDGPCAHALWSVDGAMVATPAAAIQPTLDDACVEPSQIRSVPTDVGYQILGTYRIPCGAERIDYVVDYTSGARERTSGMYNLLRPLPEHDVRWPHVHGWRSDVESLFRTIQAKLPDGRATRLKLEHFWVEMICHALAINAVCWDVHVAQHTEHGRKQYARLTAGSKS